MHNQDKPEPQKDSACERISQGMAELGFDIVTDCLPDSFSLAGLLIVGAVFLVGLLIWAIRLSLQD
jgi:hypothetical protein